MQALISRKINIRTFLLLVSAWLFLSLSQTLHFYLYYEQSLSQSIYWSFRDWLVWFAIFAFLFCIVSRRKFLLETSPKVILIVAIIAVTSGLAHILIVNSIGTLAGTSTRPFWVDVNRLYSKRWLQYLFTFFVYWLLIKNYFSQRNTSQNSVIQNNDQSTIKVNDGKQNHGVKRADIASVEAAGNYVCFHIGSEQVIARGTIKAVEDELQGSNFLRVSRSHLVNIAAIERSTRISRSKVQLDLVNGTVVPVGPSYWRKVKESLKL